MRISKLCILACCVGVSGATFLATSTVAQSSQSAAAASSSDEQTRALEALRQAEAGPVVPDVFANPGGAAVAPSPAPSTTGAPASIVAPEPAITSTPRSSDDQNRALDALRKAESQPIPPEQGIAPGRALTMSEKEALLIEAQRRRKLAEEKALTDRTAAEEAARHQREADDLKVKQAMEAERAATEQARSDIAAQEANAAQQAQVDDMRIKQAMAAEQQAAELVRIARAEEAAAAERARVARLQAEAAERARIARAQSEAGQLKRQMEATAANAPGMGPEPEGPPSAKEQKLADLLRRYQADEITPYEYHLQRAKIVAEP